MTGPRAGKRLNGPAFGGPEARPWPIAPPCVDNGHGNGVPNRRRPQRPAGPELCGPDRPPLAGCPASRRGAVHSLCKLVRQPAASVRDSRRGEPDLVKNPVSSQVGAPACCLGEERGRGRTGLSLGESPIWPIGLRGQTTFDQFAAHTCVRPQAPLREPGLGRSAPRDTHPHPPPVQIPSALHPQDGYSPSPPTVTVSTSGELRVLY